MFIAGQIGNDIEKILLAALLGGLIGLERELKHGPAGLRTNIFICVGAAMFTFLSDELAGGRGGDHTRIAAQIIPGIGFIGAGSILHSRTDLISGITTAATIFVTAAVGMAVGGGASILAVLATLLVLGVLLLLGAIERLLSLKIMIHRYEVAGQCGESTRARINELLEPMHAMMLNSRVAVTPRHVRIHFECEGARRHQAQVFQALQGSGAFDYVVDLGPVQVE